jgi:hypothetical protein
MVKSQNEYIAINPKGKSTDFMTAYADMQDEIERHRAAMRDMGDLLLTCAVAEGFEIPKGKQARIVASRFDGALQIMLSDVTTARRSF